MYIYIYVHKQKAYELEIYTYILIYLYIYIYIYISPLACSNSDFRTSNCFCKASSKFEPGVAAPGQQASVFHRDCQRISVSTNKYHQVSIPWSPLGICSSTKMPWRICRILVSWASFKKKNKQLQYFTSPTHKKNKNTPENHHLAIQCLPRAFTRSPTNTPPKRVSFRSKMSTFRGAFTAWPAFHAAVPPVPSRHQDAARRLTFRTDQVARRRRIHGEAPRLGGNPRFQTPETVWGVCAWFSVYLKEMAVF